MKREVIIGIAIVVLLILAGGYYMVSSDFHKQTPSSQNQSAQTNVLAPTVLIENFAFNPATINIKIGETVKWINADSAPHTIVSDSGSEIASSSLSTGGQYTHAFNVAGTYEYHCGIHASMKGKVVVN